MGVRCGILSQMDTQTGWVCSRYFAVIKGARLVVAECSVSRSQTVLLGSPDRGFSSVLRPTQLWISFPLPECVGVGLHSGGEHRCALPGDNHHLLCFCSVQNKLLSKGLSLTHPPASPSCLPSPDPAAASSPSTVDSVSPARKVAVLNN